MNSESLIKNLSVVFLIFVLTIGFGSLSLGQSDQEERGGNSVLQGGSPAFSPTVAEEEAYWYSRYNMGNLLFRSGLGEAFSPEKKKIKSFIKLVDKEPGDGDTARPPTNVILLKSVYAGGDPHYTEKIDINDFATQRWNPDTFDTTVTSQAMGWTIIKEVEWAKQFHVDDHFGTPSDDFGAQWRFVGMMLNAQAKMQTKYALTELKNEQGLIANSDGTVSWDGQWVMLEAFSDIGNALGLTHLPYSSTNRYLDSKSSNMFMKVADDLFNELSSRKPTDTEELSLAIQGLTWYAASTQNTGNKALAVALIRQYGEVLSNTSTKDLASRKAFAIRGLIESYRVSGEDQYLNAAATLFNALVKDYNRDYGVFTSQNTYSIDDVAIILGALNSLKHFGGDAVNQTKVEEIFTGFFESVVNLSGLQQSAPPKAVAKGAFEQKEPDIYYAYPGMPKPPMAGGTYGIAPVFATEIQWSKQSWNVTDDDFDTAGAMHAANEFIWFHKDEVNGFPKVETG